MRPAVALLLAVFLVHNASSQTTGAVTGSITDAETHMPLPGAHIAAISTGIVTSSDSDGKFTLELPAGSHDLAASYVGYSTRTVNVVIVAGDTTRTLIPLVTEPIAREPITVTATRGRERETPATFSTLDPQQLRERYTTQDIPVLLSELPSTTYYSESGNGIGYTYLDIRGFDSRRIAVMVNGIPQNDPEDHNVYWLDMPDLAGSLEDIQVQRGAGSAFYGPPAIGGSVNLVTQNFAKELSLQVSAGVGSYDTRKYSASFSSGLIENRYAVHARLARILSDGYRIKSWVDFSSYFLGMVRYDEHMTTQLNLYGGPIADGLAYYGIPKAYVKDRNLRRVNPIMRPEEIENFSQPHYEVINEWRIGPSVTVNNTFFFVEGEGFFDYDGSWAPYAYFRLTPQNGFAITGDPDTLYLPGALIRAVVHNRQYGWLPNVRVKHENGEFVAGTEIRIHRSDHYGELQWSTDLPADVPRDYRYYEFNGAKDILSVYVHELYHATPLMTLTFDLQYAYSRYHLYNEKYIGTDFAVAYHFLNPRVGMNYNFDERWNGYVTVAFTSREPRLNNLYDAAEASTPASWGAVVPNFAADARGRFDFSNPLVKPESLLDFELGTGYRNDHLALTANIYWMEFSDEIVKSGQVDRFGQPITGNADRTRHIGLELTGRVLVSNLEGTFNATFSRNRFVHNTDYSTGTAIPLDRNPIAGFPAVLFNGRLSYRMEDVGISLSGRYVGKQYTDNFKNEVNTVDPYFVTDGWISWKISNLVSNVALEAKLQVNNIFDVLYASHGEGDAFFVGAERNAFVNFTIDF